MQLGRLTCHVTAISAPQVNTDMPQVKPVGWRRHDYSWTSQRRSSVSAGYCFRFRWVMHSCWKAASWKDRNSWCWLLRAHKSVEHHYYLHTQPQSHQQQQQQQQHRGASCSAIKTQLNEPPTKVNGLQGEKSWKLIRIPDPWKVSQVFFWNFRHCCNVKMQPVDYSMRQQFWLKRNIYVGLYPNEPVVYILEVHDLSALYSP